MGKSGENKKDKSNLLGKLASLFGGDKEDDEWEKNWEARTAALEKIFGKTDGMVLHAVIPLALGGDADVLKFPNFPGGIAYVTSELTGQNCGQVKNALGNYELMICSKGESTAASDFISKAAKLTVKRELKVGEVVDFREKPNMPFDGVLFTEGHPQAHFDFLGNKWGVLLCIGITSQDLAVAAEKGAAGLLAQLKSEGRFPFSTFRAASTSSDGWANQIPEALLEQQLRGVSKEFFDELNTALGELKLKVKSCVESWRLGGFERWDMSQDEGLLIFTRLDGTKVKCPAQVIGSFSAGDKSWEWAWNNPYINDSLKADSKKLLEYGQAHQLPHLIDGKRKPFSEQAGWAVTALSVKMNGNAGAYVGTAGPLKIFIAFNNPLPEEGK